MTLFEFIKISERDFDVYDDVFDAEVTVCYIEENKHLTFKCSMCKRYFAIESFSVYKTNGRFRRGALCRECNAKNVIFCLQKLP